MKILMLTHNMAGVGGSFMRSYTLARELVRLGNRVTLLAASKRLRLWPYTETVDGVRIIQMPDLFPARLRHGGLSPTDILGRLGYVIVNGYSIVHGFDHRPGVSMPALVHRLLHKNSLFVSDWADLWGKGGIADSRGGLEMAILGNADHHMERLIRRLADGLTVVSSNLAQRAADIDIPAHRVHSLTISANIDIIRPLSKIDMRRKYGLPLDAHIAVHIGFAGYDAVFLGQSFVELTQRDPKALMLMTGGKLAAFERVIGQSILHDRIIDLGFVPYQSLGEVLACGDVMLLPYTNRSINTARIPNKLGDYLAAGRPIVTNRTGALESLMEEENIGSAVDDTPEAFAEAIVHLFTHPELRETMGRHARRVAESKYSPETQARALLSFYEELLST